MHVITHDVIMHGFVSKIKIVSSNVDKIVAIYDGNKIIIKGEWNDIQQMWVMKFYCNITPNSRGYDVKIKWVAMHNGKPVSCEDRICVNECDEYEHCRKYVLDEEDGIRDE